MTSESTGPFLEFATGFGTAGSGNAIDEKKSPSSTSRDSFHVSAMNTGAGTSGNNNNSSSLTQSNSNPFTINTQADPEYNSGRNVDHQNQQHSHHHSNRSSAAQAQQQQQQSMSNQLPPASPKSGDEGGAVPAEEEQPPEGTLHMALWDWVTFVPYPTERFTLPTDAVPAEPAPGEELVRCFIGQLPYLVTDMQLAWLCYTFGRKHTVTYPERITKKQPNSSERLPTGCIHAFCTRQAIEEMATLMHKKILVDDTGVWVALSAEEERCLFTYVQAMKRAKGRRPPNRPYDTLVVQLATSTYIPRHVASVPQLTTALNASDQPDVALYFKSRQDALQYYWDQGQGGIEGQHGGHHQGAGHHQNHASYHGHGSHHHHGHGSHHGHHHGGSTHHQNHHHHHHHSGNHHHHHHGGFSPHLLSGHQNPYAHASE